MSDLLPSDGPRSDADWDLARDAVGRRWISQGELEKALEACDADPGLSLLDRLPLTPEQRAALRGTVASPRPLPPLVAEAARNPSQCMGRYVVMEPLGGGGMGVVVKAFDVQLRRWVALKFLKGFDDPVAREYFEREARLAAGLTHQNIAAIYEHGTHDGKPFIAMQFVDGKTLGAARGALSTFQRVKAIEEAALAVDFAHRANIVHRDLKPGNLMLDQAGRVFVMDFGLAKQTEVEGFTGGLTGSSVLLGTPDYMSPEQARGDIKQVDARSDIWSLGATLYEVLTGKPPFKSESRAETLVKILQQDPPRPRATAPEIPGDLETIVLKCLEKDRDRRYPSAQEFALDLRRFLEDRPILAHPPSRAYRLWKWCARHRLAAVALVLAGISVAAGTGIGAAIWMRSQYSRIWLEERERELQSLQNRDSKRRQLLLESGDRAYRERHWKDAYAAYKELHEEFLPADPLVADRLEHAKRELKVLEYRAGNADR